MWWTVFTAVLAGEAVCIATVYAARHIASGLRQPGPEYIAAELFSLCPTCLKPRQAPTNSARSQEVADA